MRNGLVFLRSDLRHEVERRELSADEGLEHYIATWARGVRDAGR